MSLDSLSACTYSHKLAGKKNIFKPYLSTRRYNQKNSGMSTKY